MLYRIPQDRRTADDTRLQRLQKEDAFMQEHGGAAACLVYQLVCQLGDFGAAFDRVRRLTIRPARQPQSQGPVEC